MKPDHHAGGTPFYRLRLFVAGDEPNSIKAREVLSRLCAEHLGERCEIHVVDIFEDYQAAIDNQVIVVPTLIMDAPTPGKTLVGSLSDEGKLLAALGITGKGERA
ncbi:MAG: circadian clock protein KaiB [Spirochaetes bacterium]|nr:MAG: circadian clock protein KaiB [Spirochaetota bacterium]